MNIIDTKGKKGYNPKERFKVVETKPLTNYDSLISKTPEEMANALASVETGVNTYGDDVYYHWLSWLKSPAKEGEG